MWDIQLRKIDYGIFPFESKKVPFIKMSFRDEIIVQATNKNQKIEMLISSHPTDIILAAWPGEWSQDVFIVDDRSLALSILDGTKEFSEIINGILEAEISLGPQGGINYLSVHYTTPDEISCHTGFRGAKGRKLYNLLLENKITVRQI